MVRLTDRPDMTLDVYRGHKTITQQQQFFILNGGKMEVSGDWMCACGTCLTWSKLKQGWSYFTEICRIMS